MPYEVTPKSIQDKGGKKREKKKKANCKEGVRFGTELSTSYVCKWGLSREE